MKCGQYNSYLVSKINPWFSVLERKVLDLQFVHLPIKLRCLSVKKIQILKFAIVLHKITFPYALYDGESVLQNSIYFAEFPILLKPETYVLGFLITCYYK